MNDEHSGPVPTEIKLNKASRTLDLSFDDGSHFSLPCEYLRVFSPAADVRVARDAGDLVMGKQQVNIAAINPIGNYAVQLVFDDDHDTGIYSWSTLYELGRQHEQNWQSYLAELDAHGIQREQPPEQGPRHIQLLYFATLATHLRRETDEFDLPAAVRDINDLLAWLGKQGMLYQQALDNYTIKVTVNKQFVDYDTLLADGDEIAMVAISEESIQ